MVRGRTPERSSKMSKGFNVDFEYQGYVFLGGAQGTFEARNGRRVPFFNMFVLSPTSTYTSEDYRAFGFKSLFNIF